MIVGRSWRIDSYTRIQDTEYGIGGYLRQVGRGKPAQGLVNKKPTGSKALKRMQSTPVGRFFFLFLREFALLPRITSQEIELNSLFQTLASPWGDLKAENSENKVHAVKFILRHLRRERSKVL
jgi:hypothetical protein